MSRGAPTASGESDEAFGTSLLFLTTTFILARRKQLNDTKTILEKRSSKKNSNHKKIMITFLCHCGSQKNYISCCSPLLSGVLPATTAEAMMRSRYTAYVRKDEAYLLRTWHQSTRPKKLVLQGPVEWMGLQIRKAEGGGANELTGVVEFVANYKEEGISQQLTERSKFVKEKGQWFYVDGDTPKEPTQRK
jgi:SEC-C motif domain protein